MSIVTEFHVDEKRFRVITYDWSFNQTVDANGRPVAASQGGIMRILVETEQNEPFTEWAVNPTMMKSAKLKQRSVNLDGKSRIIDLVDVYCLEATDNYSSTGTKNLSTSLVLSPAQILVDGVKKMEKHWKVTDLDAKNVAPTTRQQEPEKEKKCTVEFDADNGDVRDGKFGFDKLTNKLLRICESGEAKLKNEYDPITVDGEEYFPPWVSMRKGQTITLKVKSKFDNKGEYKSVALEDHPDFTFEPKNLKDASEIKITCNNTNPSTAQVKVLADGNDAGAINFFYPEPKSIDLEWFFVEISGDKDDFEKLKGELKRTELIELLKKGINPALIDINLKNPTANIIDISEYKEGLENRKVLLKHSNTSIGKYIERGKFTSVRGAIDIKHKSNSESLTLYVINRKCINTADIDENGTFEMAGGLSPTGTGIAYMVLDDSGDINKDNVMHELMHALDLQHTFNDMAKHRFKPQRTNNYMDYKTSKDCTWSWQWKKLNAYPKLK